MKNYVSIQSDSPLNEECIFDLIDEAIGELTPNGRKFLLLPPDYTRFHSFGGQITAHLYKKLSEQGLAVSVLPATGTHDHMTEQEVCDFFGGMIPYKKILRHDWRGGIVKLGEIPGEYVSRLSEGLVNNSIDVEVSKAIVDRSFDAIISIGQVVPHEVAGMSNHNKNIFVGCGGGSIINGSHMLGAIYGMERIIGRVKTPVRELFNYAEDKFLKDIPITYLLTVTTGHGREVNVHGVFAGKGREMFEKAAELSHEKNIFLVGKPVKKMVVNLDLNEFKSAWLANKAIYRTRMAIEDGGELVILAPGVAKFGEDFTNDNLIRKYGYKGREYIVSLLKCASDLNENLSVAAHLIHGSSEGRFKITYAVIKLDRETIENVGYNHSDYESAANKYRPFVHREGFNTLPNGEEFYYVDNPALGLWACPSLR
ncbi:MAG: lactate racemase domain-containing protein [Clostridiales bacterium]|jgi:nickel-dependent lactate racemase|nr:lactate racemase domain-containing protein [Clostridiales bacterium]